MKPHPMQPVVLADDNVVRFKKNALVKFLLDFASGKGMGMNELHAIPGISKEDWNQFVQLIGYSVSGFGDLSYADPEMVALADIEAEAIVKGKSK